MERFLLQFRSLIGDHNERRLHLVSMQIILKTFFFFGRWHFKVLQERWSGHYENERWDGDVSACVPGFGYACFLDSDIPLHSYILAKVRPLLLYGRGMAFDLANKMVRGPGSFFLVSRCLVRSYC